MGISTSMSRGLKSPHSRELHNASVGGVSKIVRLPRIIEIETNQRLDVLSSAITAMAAQAKREAQNALVA